jgi:hypothetical protein
MPFNKATKISIIGSLSVFQSQIFPMVLDPFTFFQISNRCVDVGPTFCIDTISIQLTLDLNSKVKVHFHEYNASAISTLRTRDLAYTCLGFQSEFIGTLSVRDSRQPSRVKAEYSSAFNDTS